MALLWAACTAQSQKGEAAQVTIYRDTWGVPHIYGDTEEAGYFGLGYAQAVDGLQRALGAAFWVQGRSAELLGDAALPGDIEMRRWHHYEEGQAGFARLSPQLQKNYRAFLAGIKRYMSDHPDRVPKWALELTPEMLVAISRAIWFSFYIQQSGPAECAKAGVDLQLGWDGDEPPPVLAASNEWAVLPSRTRNGETILLADPHVEMNDGSYYEYRLNGGDFSSAGFAAGALLWQAQNRHVAWAYTTGSPDLWDCYAVETDPANPRQYLYDGHARTIEVRKETFRSASGKVVEQEFEYTRHNGVLSPVVARQGRMAYAVSTSQMHDAGLFDEEIYRMNRARSVAQLREGLKTLGQLPQNLMAVDDQGHGYYLRAGKTPRRPPGYDWSAPVPGNTSATAWLGFHSLDEMIQVRDPAQGYMQNNNVAADRLFAHGNLDASNYPAYMFNDIPGRVTTRGQRSLDVLSKANDFTVAQATEHAFDEYWITTPPWQDALRYAVEMQPERLAKLSPPARTLVDRILSFDGQARAESVAALNFLFWRAEAGERLFAQPEFAGLREFPWPRSKFTPAFAEALLEEAEQAAAAQTKAAGDIDQPLGKLFRIAFGNANEPLGGTSIHANGRPERSADIVPEYDSTLRAFESKPEKNGELHAYRGSQGTRLVVLGRNAQSWSLRAFGQQMDPTAPHGADQVPLISRRQFKPMLLRQEELLKHVESSITLDVPL
ncbi:MAG: penicillin acylase family protein [Steroidobacteraceae bacterium]